MCFMSLGHLLCPSTTSFEGVVRKVSYLSVLQLIKDGFNHCLYNIVSLEHIVIVSLCFWLIYRVIDEKNTA